MTVKTTTINRLSFYTITIELYNRDVDVDDNNDDDDDDDDKQLMSPFP